jgi:DNA-binding transcriptional LysR family regulator
MFAGFSVLPRARRISYQLEELEAAAGGNLPHEPNNNIVYKPTAAETRQWLPLFPSLKRKSA